MLEVRTGLRDFLPGEVKLRQGGHVAGVSTLGNVIGRCLLPRSDVLSGVALVFVAVTFVLNGG
jgi:hypothetical protein